MMHLFFMKVEYYRSFEYSVKWKDPMNSKRNSRRPKTLKAQTSPNSSEEPIQRKIGGKRQQKRKKRAQSGNTGADVDKQSIRDVLDVIDRSREDLPDENGPLVEVADEGVDHSDDDQVSVSSSVLSGPSRPYNPSDDKPLTLCPACRKLQQRVKRMKKPLKDKLLDTNPKSLTCDQWILLKPWRSKKKLDSRKNLFGLAQLIRKLRVVKKGKEKKELAIEIECSRPHLFLQRNLRHGIKNPIMKEKKKNQRKRAREDSQGPRVAKQKRTHSNHQPIGNSRMHNTEPIRNSLSHNNSVDPMSTTSSFDSGPDDSDLTFRLPPVTVPSEASDSFNDFPNQTVPKRGGGFRDLLAQLRGNNSMIIRETRY
ncbi:uncharacterized protein [Eucyclogobius newberryi]|uniref:uncharacterized protein n=1 Tax=Eucyclogobius newberryi TaxID=166745 RepID=UPI003B59E1CF